MVFDCYPKILRRENVLKMKLLLRSSSWKTVRGKRCQKYEVKDILLFVITWKSIVLICELFVFLFLILKVVIVLELKPEICVHNIITYLIFLI